MTGLSTMGVDVAGKRVQLVKDTLPGISRIALLYDPVTPYNVVQEISESKIAGDRLKIKVTEFKAGEVKELASAFIAINQGGYEAIILAQGELFEPAGHLSGETFLKNKILTGVSEIAKPLV